MKAGTVELRIERLVAGGYGLARAPEGAVLVAGALPGELVTARPAMRRGALRAHAIDILEPSPARVDLPLPPGADLPMEYAAQLPIKQGLVEEALVRVAKLEAPVEAIVPASRPLGYRTAAQYAVLDDGGLGARARGSDRIVPVQTDLLAAEEMARAFAVCAERSLHGVEEVAFRASLHARAVVAGLIGTRSAAVARVARALEDAGVAGVVWAAADDRGRFRGKSEVLAGRDRMLEDFGGVLATVTVRSFAQVNPPAAGALYRDAAARAGTGARALDLYAGSGILGLHLAASFDEVVAIEIARDAVVRGQADARRLGAASILFHRGDARAAAQYLPADVVVMDPPRAGLDADVIEILNEQGPPRLVYVSCDPTTWARDLARFAASGYRPTLIRPYDFYPYTHHVEVLSVLER